VRQEDQQAEEDDGQQEVHGWFGCRVKVGKSMLSAQCSMLMDNGLTIEEED